MWLGKMEAGWKLALSDFDRWMLRLYHTSKKSITSFSISNYLLFFYYCLWVSKYTAYYEYAEGVFAMLYIFWKIAHHILSKLYLDILNLWWVSYMSVAHNAPNDLDTVDWVFWVLPPQWSVLWYKFKVWMNVLIQQIMAKYININKVFTFIKQTV